MPNLLDKIKNFIIQLAVSLLYRLVWLIGKLRSTSRIKRLTRHLVDHFIPHEGNNHHPHALKHRLLFGYSVILILLKVAAVILPVALPSSSLFSSAITSVNIVDLTNQTRTNLGLRELKTNKLLAAAAAAKAQDILQNQYFAHTSPSGLTPWDWIIQAGYDYLYAGENLAVHYQSAEDVTEGWLASPTHRANIIQPKYTEIGVGIAQGDFENIASTVVVQMFGTPHTPSSQPPTKTSVAVKPTPRPPQTIPPAVINNNTGKVAAAEVKTEAKGAVKSAPPQNNKPSGQAAQPAPPVANRPLALIPSADSNIETVATATAVQPVVYDDTIKIIPQTNSYFVSLVATGATAVMVQLANEWTSLTRPGASSTWQGTIPFQTATFNKSGEQLSVVAWSNTGQVVSKALAIVAPLVKTQQFYNFNEGTDKYATFFGFITVHNLQDKVRQFYFFFIVFLAAALLLNVLIKIRIQHFSVISHTLLVIGLTLILLIV